MTQVETETGVLAGDERMLIDGEFQTTSTGATFDVIHSASERVAGVATDGTVEDMALERNKERLHRLLITEVGCPVSVTGSQIESPIEVVKHWAEHGKAFDYRGGVC